MCPFVSPAQTTPEAFPEDFAWGAATSALQVEGFSYGDQGGRSIWSVLDNKPAFVKDGSNDLIADDSYHLFEQDISLLKDMDLNSYRFSISWPRVLPEGKGRPDTKGLDYYDRLIDGLLDALITPWVTVYHFDYPEALEQKGGWLHPDSSRWLGDYAAILSKRFGDRVQHWMTINEPNITWGRVGSWRCATLSQTIAWAVGLGSTQHASRARASRGRAPCRDAERNVH